MTWLLAVSMIEMLCSLYGQEPTPVSSLVRAVTVYPDRARVTRTATATLPEGAGVLQFVGLPEGLEEDSVVVHGQSDAALTIEFVAQQLSVHKRPREIRVVDALPRNAMGKVLKKRLLSEG